MNSKLFSNTYGFLINTLAIGFNFNDYINHLKQALQLVNINTVLTIIISLLAIVWWRVKIKDIKIQREIHQIELKKKRLELECDQAKHKTIKTTI